MNTLKLSSITGALAGLFLLGHAPVALGGPVFHNQAVNPVQHVPAVGPFQTTGADMDGMAVTAFFSDGTEEEVTWDGVSSAATGVTHNWSLSVPAAGDTYVTPWTLLYEGGNGLLTGFQIDGFGDAGPGETAVMFDRTLDSLGGLAGTPGSEKGRDLEEVAPLPFAVHVRYTGAIDTPAPGPAFEDEFRWLNVNFFELAGTPDSEFITAQPQPVGLDGINLRAWEFRQDTNSVIVPEPGSVGLLMVTLAVLMAAIPHCRRKFDRR